MLNNFSQNLTGNYFFNNPEENIYMYIWLTFIFEKIFKFTYMKFN